MLDVLIIPVKDQGPEKRALNVSNRTDKPLKSVLKSISWRIVGTIDTMVISYFITGKFAVAVSIGGVEVITKTVLYYFHERLWARIHRIKLNIFSKSNGKRYELKRTEPYAQGKIDRRLA